MTESSRLSYDVSTTSLDCHNKRVGSPLVFILCVLIIGVFSSLLRAGEAEEEDQRRSVGGREWARLR